MRDAQSDAYYVIASVATITICDIYNIILFCLSFADARADYLVTFSDQFLYNIFFLKYIYCSPHLKHSSTPDVATEKKNKSNKVTLRRIKRRASTRERQLDASAGRLITNVRDLCGRGSDDEVFFFFF